MYILYLFCYLFNIVGSWLHVMSLFHIDTINFSNKRNVSINFHGYHQKLLSTWILVVGKFSNYKVRNCKFINLRIINASTIPTTAMDSSRCTRLKRWKILSEKRNKNLNNVGAQSKFF